MKSVLVCHGCHNKVLQTEWLKWWKISFSQCTGCKSKTKESSKAASPFYRSASDGCLRLSWAFRQLPPTFRGPLSVSPSLCPNFSFFIKTQSHWMRGPPNDLILTRSSTKTIFSKSGQSHPQISEGEWEFQRLFFVCVWGGGHNSTHNRMNSWRRATGYPGDWYVYMSVRFSGFTLCHLFIIITLRFHMRFFKHRNLGSEKRCISI